MALTLKSMDGERVTVNMQVQERHVSLVGVALYFNTQLEIYISDPAGSFTIVLDEATWAGSIQQDATGSYIITVGP